jgi:acyl carrier protein phosphodiesterase
MNYLAHQFLSGTNKEIRVGNFLGDFMRGRELSEFSETIKLGIELHKLIDEFTDKHEVVYRSKKIIHPRQGKYASVLLDVYYDYFLAKNWDKFSNEPLQEFAASVYADFWELRINFSDKIISFLPNMRENDWFTNYRSYWGINKALQSIARRAKYSNTINNSLLDLQELETELEADFLIFMPELKQRCDQFLTENGLV